MSGEKKAGHFGIVLPYTRKYWAFVAITVLCAVAGAFAASAAGSAIKTLTDAAAQGNWEMAAGTILPVIALILGGALAAFGGSASSEYFGTAVSRDMRADAVRRMLSYPYAYFEGRHTGDLVSRLNNDLSEVQYFFQGTFCALIRETLFFIVICGALVMLDFKLLVPTLLLTPITIIVNWRIGKSLRDCYRRQQEGYASLTGAVQDTVQGIGIVKAYSLYRTMMEKIRGGNALITESVLGVVKIATDRTYVSAINQAVPLLITLIWGGYRAIQGDMSPGDLFAFLYLYRYLNSAITSIPDLTSEVQGIRGMLERTNPIWDLPPERRDGSDFKDSPGNPILKLKDVRFSYIPEYPVLDGISLEVGMGETLALVGGSGCGKSTILKLICALRDPDSGTISLHGHEYREWSLGSLRERISLVSQDTFLFPASVAENIAYGADDAGRERIEAAAEAAGAAPFIRDLPEGYETLVGERGVRLSGGQRQRIAIARALLKDAPILVLDEPTSSLDSESEAQVQEAIERLMEGRTVIVAAHRLSTVRKAERILVIGEGRIIEGGNHEALIAAKGAYYRLYRRQTEEAHS